MKTIVLYHRADFDGIFCREIARKFMPHAEFIGWDYGDPVPDPTIVSADDTLYMLDISIDGLMGHPKLIWIDHHKSAMEKFGKLLGYQIDGVAACRLAWQWFNRDPIARAFSHMAKPLPDKQDFIDRKVAEPLAVRLAGEYDIWDKRDPNAELFQHGLRSCDISETIWDILLTPDHTFSTGEFEALMESGQDAAKIRDELPANAYVVMLLNAGRGIQYAKANENEGIIKSYGFDVEFEGLKFLACNHARFNSHLFLAGTRPDHDALLGFNWSGKDWRVSLYHAPGKEQHDLSLIASKYGGGGHKGACGFRMDVPPWLFK